MKKIVLLSLMTLSGSLLGIKLPNNQPSTNQTPRPAQQHASQASRQGQRTVRSPQEQPVQTHGPRITERRGMQLASMFRRNMYRAVAESDRQETSMGHGNNDPRQTQDVMTTSQHVSGTTVRRPRPNNLIVEHSGDTGALVAPHTQYDGETNS